MFKCPCSPEMTYIKNTWAKFHYRHINDQNQRDLKEFIDNFNKMIQ